MPNETLPGMRDFDLGRPEGKAKDEYLWQWNNAYNTVFWLIQNNRNQPNNRDVVHAVMMSISLVAHDNLRRKNMVVFRNGLQHIRNAKLDADSKLEESMWLCAETMGHLTSYVDQYRGLAHTLRVGELYNFSKSYASIPNAFPRKVDGDPIII